MSKYQDLQNLLLSKLYNAKQNNTDLREVKKQIVDKLIIENGAGMVEVLKDLNNLGYTHITFANGLNKRFFTGIKEDYITLKGMDFVENHIPQSVPQGI